MSEAASISWSKLELRKASTLRKEVDDAIKQFNAAIEAEEMGQIQALRDSFASRIDELEDFYGDNDSDDRAVLFEKQRLRLRQALQVANPSPKKAPAPSSPSAITTPGGKSATLGSPSTTPKSATLGGRKSTTPKSATKTTPGSSPRKKKSPGPPKPLYNWEMTSTPPTTKERTAIESPHGEFIPSLSPGFYELRNALPSSTKFIDFQVVLSEQDYQDLLTRRRRMNAEAKHTMRFATKKAAETPYLNASTPYVDVSKVQASLYRS